MKIELVFRAPIERGFDECMRRNRLEVPEGTDIASILPLVHGEALAKWQDDKLGGMVVGDYKELGKLEDGCSYMILSKDIKKTIRALDELDPEDYVTRIKESK